MLTGARTRVMILDACRNNPFGERLKTLTRGGLGQMSARGGLVAYATEAGDTAADNGLYARHLVTALRVPGLPATELFTRVSEAVETASGGEQVPVQQLAGAAGRFVFHPGDVIDPRPPPDSETVFWQSIQGSADPADFAAYLERFANGTFALLARNRLAALRGPVDAPLLRQETVFWESIRESENASEFELFLERYPNGVFAELAQGRLAALHALADAAGADVPRGPGDIFRDCDECPEMVVQRGGRLALGRYEVTVGEYRAFASATGGGAGSGVIGGERGWGPHNRSGMLQKVSTVVENSIL